MKPAPFELHRPRSLAEAVELLGSFGPDADVGVLAGGQSLVPLMNFRLARPDHLIDLSAVPDLDLIGTEGATVTIGAMARQQDVLDDPTVAARLPLLVEAMAHVGHRHIRNRGTIGGSLAHADPAAELPTVAVALDAELVAEGRSGRRAIAASDFFPGWFTTALTSDELLVAVRIPAMDHVDGGSLEWGFAELARRAGDFAMVLVATVVRRDGDGTVTDARVVIGGVGAAPVRSAGAEAALIGASRDGDDRAVIAAAAAAARGDCSPVDDVHATAEHRSELVEVLVARSLHQAVPVATGEPPGRSASGWTQPGDAPGAGPDGAVRVNGDIQPLDGVPARRLLADWLREDLGLTGTHLGCEHGVCGACTVLIDGAPARSCLALAQQMAGHSVTTIEDLGTPDALHPLQEAFRAHHGLQCGFCTPGMVIAALDLLARVAEPTDDRIREELSGNICRCTGYVKIVEAVKAAAAGGGDRERTTPTAPIPPPTHPST